MPQVVDMERERTRRPARVIERDLRWTRGKALAVDEGKVGDPVRWRRVAVMAAHPWAPGPYLPLARQWQVDLDYPVTKEEEQDGRRRDGRPPVRPEDDALARCSFFRAPKSMPATFSAAARSSCSTRCW